MGASQRGEFTRSTSSDEMTSSDEIRQLIEELTCGDDPRAEIAVKNIANHGESCLESLEELIHSEEIEHRWWAIRTLAEMPEPPSDWLIQALDDENEEIRQCAALALVHHPGTEAIEGLLKAIRSEDGITSRIAADALITIGKDTIPGLINLLSEMVGNQRAEAFRAIARIQDQSCIPILMAGLDEDSLLIKYWAEEGLTRLGLDMVYFPPS